MLSLNNSPLDVSLLPPFALLFYEIRRTISDGFVFTRYVAPEFYVAAAISFYKALKVYPAPQELIMIYQKSLPPAVFDLVMELISLEINAAASSSSSSRGGGGPQIKEEPILQELEEGEKGENQAEKEDEEDNEEEIQVNNNNSSKAPSSTTGSEGSPSSGSFVHVETDTNEGDAVKVQVGTSSSSISDETPAPASASDDPPEEPIAA